MNAALSSTHNGPASNCDAQRGAGSPRGADGRHGALRAPVIYAFFNRPELVRRTFAAIRAQQPRRLYLIADGPREQKPDDPARCRAAREAVEQMIDWPCDVIRDYSETNLGTGRRVSSGLDAAFAAFGEGIVIEDDILAHPDFFVFCDEALERYRDDAAVHGISGYNPLGRYLPHERRAVPARTHLTWGWASWNRAWTAYRRNFERWHEPEVQARIRADLANDLYFSELVRAFKATEAKEVDAWDYQWVFTMLYERRHAIVSAVNLVENLGFIGDATHTFHAPTFAAGLRTHRLPASPLPCAGDAPDSLFDRLHWRVYLGGSPLKTGLFRLLARSNRALAAALIRR